MEKIVLVGSGGHAKTIVDTIERAGYYQIAGFIDCGKIGREVYRGYRIIGHDEDMDAIFASGIHHAFIAIGFMGNSDLRGRLYHQFKLSGFSFPVITDPSAVIAKDTVIGEGTYIGRKAVVNVDAEIGMNCIVNTAAVIEHDGRVGDFSHVSVAGVLCGQVTVGKNAMIGANATVIQGITVGDGAIIGAGATVVKDVPGHCTVAGIPAKEIGKGARVL